MILAESDTNSESVKLNGLCEIPSKTFTVMCNVHYCEMYISIYSPTAPKATLAEFLEKATTKKDSKTEKRNSGDLRTKSNCQITIQVSS